MMYIVFPKGQTVPRFGGAFVDFFIQNIAEAFGLKIKSAARERFGQLCLTTGKPGLVLIQKAKTAHGKPAEAQAESIVFSHKIKEHLFCAGFETLDRYFTSKHTGEPYHKVADDIFTATIAFDVPNANFCDTGSFLSVIAELAKMHKVLEQADFAVDAKQAPQANFEKDFAALTSLRKKIIKAGKYSDFDMLFLTAYEKFAENMLMPQEQTGHNNYICHNLLKEENIYMGKKPIFTNFALASFGQHQNDLIYIIKRYLKAGGGAGLSLDEILDTYSKHKDSDPLNHKDFTKQLQYPDKFVKLSKDYYSKKRSFAPKAYITRMEECLARGEAVNNWLGIGS